MRHSSMTTLPRLVIMIVMLLALVPVDIDHGSSQSSVQCGDPLDSRYASTSLSPGRWRVLGDMPRPRSEFAAAVIDDWIYVVGGFGGLAQVDCFHPATGTWAIAPDLPVGVHHVAVASLDGTLYAAGGYTEAGPATAILWAYDPEAGKWAERAPMSTARGALGLVAYEGKLYGVGGATERLGGSVTGVIEIYDPVTDTWEPGADMPTPREHLAVAAGDGRIFAVGGRANGDEGDTFAAAAEAYDPATDSWEVLAPLPTPRGGVSGAYTSGHMIIIGGERGTTTFDTVEAFDVDTSTWIELPPMPTARHGVASAAISDTIFAIGGSTQAGVVENTAATEALTFPPPVPEELSGTPDD